MGEGRTQLEYEVYNLKTLRLLVSTGIREQKLMSQKLHRTALSQFSFIIAVAILQN